MFAETVAAMVSEINSGINLICDFIFLLNIAIPITAPNESCNAASFIIKGLYKSIAKREVIVAVYAVWRSLLNMSQRL